MSRRVEKYFPDILKLTEEHFKTQIESGGIPSVYKSYISTFGAMIIENGLLPALAFFEKKDENGQERREVIIHILRKFLEQKHIISEGSKDKTLANILVDKTLTRDQLRDIESKVIDASIALKLSLRTFLKER